ncbi:MAG: putative DNA binding domain-containing protein [Gemmatimonadetes bacterium]|nr:putative DNA binding domain-containing protein [Gemmatimonadota bacterium]
MTITDSEIRRQLQLGEDGRWEFKQIEFRGAKPSSPRRDNLADEMTAFANAKGGVLLCGVTDEGEIQGLTREQMAALDRLLVEVATQSIKPALLIDVQHRKLEGQGFILVDIPPGNAVHERDGRAFVRVGSTKPRMDSDQRQRLVQGRAQRRFHSFDQMAVEHTGFETLDEALWEPLLSAAGAENPRRGLRNIRLLTIDDASVERASIAGILLCARKPHTWLPRATIMATCYRGKDRASEQLDAREIEGPLPRQVDDAMSFMVRNMRVAARKAPAREDMPQYSLAAVFEAVVNAVAHRDYSVSARAIRLSMFSDRLEIDSPGVLPNGLTVQGMHASQATRNEVIASVFGRIPVGEIPGSAHRRHLMERRGDGVSIILKETEETAGKPAEYRIVNRSSLVLTIPAAKLELLPGDTTVAVHARNEPLADVDVLALFPNKTWQRAITDEAGEARLDLYTSDLPMTVYAAARGYAGKVERKWRPDRGGLLMQLEPLPSGGAAIFRNGTGELPGLRGRLNPILDTSGRTYMYADNIAINEGRQQPVTFRLGKPVRLTDAHGADLAVTVVDMFGKSALVKSVCAIATALTLSICSYAKPAPKASR